jgi:hypothetical protein
VLRPSAHRSPTALPLSVKAAAGWPRSTAIRGQPADQHQRQTAQRKLHVELAAHGRGRSPVARPGTERQVKDVKPRCIVRRWHSTKRGRRFCRRMRNERQQLQQAGPERRRPRNGAVLEPRPRARADRTEVRLVRRPSFSGAADLPILLGAGLRLVAVCQKGTIWSYAVFHRAFHPGFKDELPYVVGIIENEDGVRYTGRIQGRVTRCRSARRSKPCCLMRPTRSPCHSGS